MSNLVSFPGTKSCGIEKAGGKGFSLVKMAHAKLPVPPGYILTTDFFEPWFKQVKASSTWLELSIDNQQSWSKLCEQLKEQCHSFSFDSQQQHSLVELYLKLKDMGPKSLFAVRSSSPEEDMATASFAGGYETRLGVRIEVMEEAIRHCFASCLDERVFIYKQANQLDLFTPRIALVIQQQLDSVVSGVAFSLNPLTNDYDEAVIDANWGQGESVVSGSVSPDSFIIDKIKRNILNKKLGSKLSSMWLDEEGGLKDKKKYRSDEFCLSENQLMELTASTCQIESLYDQPMDIEWSYANGQLYILQARPITTYIPLTKEMQTEPGEPRRLYLDAALSKGMTTNAPMSPLESDSGTAQLTPFLDKYLSIDLSPKNGLVFYSGGRLYMNLSNLLWLTSFKKMSKASAANDNLMAEILDNVDDECYRAKDKPAWIKLSNLWGMLQIVWITRSCMWMFFKSVLFPERTFRFYKKSTETYNNTFNNGLDYALSLEQFRSTYLVQMLKQGFGVTMGGLSAALTALMLIKPIVGKKSKENAVLAEKLLFGFTGNVVVEMGIALYQLAKLLNPKDFEDLSQLSTRIKNREMHDKFLKLWDDFMAIYGARGPLEMDQANPRYGDDPMLALRQMSFMTGDNNRFNPEIAHQRLVEARKQVFQQLMTRLGWFRRRLLSRVHRIIELFAGVRDTPKHQLVLFNYAMRKRALIEGEKLQKAGRLDCADQIFELTLSDIEQAKQEPLLDLNLLREKHTQFLKQLKSQVTEFPQIIDSRGRILRPAPKNEKPNEISGMPVSPGVVIGRVKVLRTTHEKTIEEGDILVAYTTDPGWTPLFVNAAAIILEVGGVLQHGAVVAREYGKPCVVGVDRVVTRLQDGQRVEVDGFNGVIRLLS
jgi:phosphoenolpyruvate synthase/pyruvate phosphate dikinase